jgi:two-component system LytT family response regulator
MKINCIAIDDEILALNKIKRYVQKVDYLNLIDCFTSALECLTFLKENKVDLIFLDIQMDELSGIEFLESLQNVPYVILTTAYEEYALKGFELNVADYLLKPISFQRFVKGCEKVYSLLMKDQLIVKNGGVSKEKEYCFIKSGTKTIKLPIDNVLYIEGMKDYLAIHTHDSRIMVLDNFKNLLHQLNSDNFIRVHKSFVVAFDKIDLFERKYLEIREKRIPVSDNYRILLKNKLEAAKNKH